MVETTQAHRWRTHFYLFFLLPSLSSTSFSNGVRAIYSSPSSSLLLYPPGLHLYIQCSFINVGGWSPRLYIQWSFMNIWSLVREHSPLSTAIRVGLHHTKRNRSVCACMPYEFRNSTLQKRIKYQRNGIHISLKKG